RDFQLCTSRKHDAHAVAAAFLRDLRGGYPPTIGRKLAAETASDVILMHTDVSGWNFQRLSHLTCNARNILCGHVNQQVVIIRPLGSGAVTLETAVGNDGDAI